MNRREENLRYPNEDSDALIDQGLKIWRTHLDFEKTRIIPRRQFDAFLIDQKIAIDFKEIETFLKGVLSGT